MNRMRSGIAALSLFALGQPQLAAAQACVSEAELASLFIYSMPSALESARNTCDGILQPDGFLATGTPRMINQYAALQAEAWPEAKRALLLFADASGPTGSQAEMRNLNTTEVLRSLPDDVARPLADAMVMQKVAEEIRPGNCQNIERVARAIAPIAPRDAAVLVATIMSMVGINEPQVCVAPQ